MHAIVQQNASLAPCCIFSRRTALVLRSHRYPLYQKPGLRSVCSAQGPGGKSTPSDEKPRESKGPPNQKPASDKPRGEPNTVPADNAPITGRPATRTPAKPQPAKQTPPAVSKEIPKANPRPQSPGPKAAAWDQGAAGDWGPVESRPDFIGKSYMLKAALAVSGADFALRTCLPA
jgi:hypothetical protein